LGRHRFSETGAVWRARYPGFPKTSGSLFADRFSSLSRGKNRYRFTNTPCQTIAAPGAMPGLVVAKPDGNSHIGNTEARADSERCVDAGMGLNGTTRARLSNSDWAGPWKQTIWAGFGGDGHVQPSGILLAYREVNCRPGNSGSFQKK